VGRHTCLRVRGCGNPNSDDWRKSLALCLLCGVRGRGRGSNTISMNFPLYTFHLLTSA
jgi:hypothetical protein